MNAMLVVAWHIVRTVVINILCRSSDSTEQFGFFYHKATFVRQGMGGSTDGKIT